MAETTEFELVSPERLLLSEPVEMVVVPGADGLFGVLPRHAPLVSTLAPGVIQVYESGQVKDRIFVAGGFAEVTPTRCTVLAERAVKMAEIDKTALQRKLKDLADDLAAAKTDDEKSAILRETRIAEAMLKAAGD
jgi:F-type H+-transporting ATPase subunit epsilon